MILLHKVLRHKPGPYLTYGTACVPSPKLHLAEAVPDCIRPKTEVVTGKRHMHPLHGSK
jgi:hypothetical protein